MEHTKLRPIPGSELGLDLVLGKAFSTRQFTLTPVMQKIIETTNSRNYAIFAHDPSVTVVIGNEDVTLDSGFIIPVDLIVRIGVLENTQLYACSSLSTTVYVLDMGMR